MNLTINNKDFLNLLEEEFNIFLKISKASEIKKAIKKYLKQRVISYLSEGNEDYVIKNFVFRESKKLDLEPTEISLNEFREIRDSLLTLLNQDKYLANTNFYYRNKNKIIKEFLGNIIKEIKVPKGGYNRLIVTKLLNNINTDAGNRYKSYYKEIRKEDLTDEAFRGLNQTIMEQLRFIDRLYKKYPEDIEIIYSLFKDNYSFYYLRERDTLFLIERPHMMGLQKVRIPNVFQHKGRLNFVNKYALNYLISEPSKGFEYKISNILENKDIILSEIKELISEKVPS